MRPKSKRTKGFGMDIMYGRSRTRSSALVGYAVLFFFGVVFGAFSRPLHEFDSPTYLDRSCLFLDEEESLTEIATLAPDLRRSAFSLTQYTVEPGDTLLAIAERFCTTPESIADINNRAVSDILAVGTVLSVLQNSSGAVKRVAKSDTVWGLSVRYGITVSSILEANGLSGPEDLVEGQLLILPGARLVAEGQAQTASRSTVLAWPLAGAITSAFGWRAHPITGVIHFHEGIDIAAPTGTKARASAAGTVACAAWSNGYGRLVILTHGNGLETRYAHLSRFAVSKGQQVLAGEVIGYVGESGDATGPHCHFEVRKDGKAKNPKDYLP